MPEWSISIRSAEIGDKKRLLTATVSKLKSFKSLQVWDYTGHLTLVLLVQHYFLLEPQEAGT